MKCFNHTACEAVGICKYCGRGLCPECLATVGKSLACKDRCEADVAGMNDLLERGKTVYQKTSRTHRAIGLNVLVLGTLICLFATWGVLDGPVGSQSLFFLLAVVGFIFLGLGLSQLAAARRFQDK